MRGGQGVAPPPFEPFGTTHTGYSFDVTNTE
jgi:hypothetical protein